jgi:hypothetical protein
MVETHNALQVQIARQPVNQRIEFVYISSGFGPSIATPQDAG